MADKKPTAAERHAATREQIMDNMDRVQSLAEAENTEGAAELSEETDALIASLPAKERNDLRNMLREAGEARKPEPEEPATTVATLATLDYNTIEGAPELVKLGTSKVTDSVNLHMKGTQTAKDVAAIILDIRRRMTNKDGLPDLTGRSNAAKTAASDMYKAAGEALKGDAYDVETAVKKMMRSAQNQMSDVMAEYLRGLDDSPEEAALYVKILEGTPEGTKTSEAVAAHYGLKLRGTTEIARSEFAAQKEIGAGADTEEEPGTPDERVSSVVGKLMRDFKAAKPEDFENASEETKEIVRKQLDEVRDALKAMIAAVV